MVEEFDSDDDPYVASDDETYVPHADISTAEDSDLEQEFIVEQEEEYDSEDSLQDETPHRSDTWASKDGTEWSSEPLPRGQTRSRNILRQKSGPAAASNISTPKELFKSIMSTEMCDIILRETNRKGKKVCDSYNNKLVQRFANNSSVTPKQKQFEPFTEQELEAFFGILIAAGVHRSNKENLEEMWKVDALPLIRAAMSRDRFKMMLRFIRFDSENTREERKKNR